METLIDIVMRTKPTALLALLENKPGYSNITVNEWVYKHTDHLAKHLHKVSWPVFLSIYPNLNKAWLSLLADWSVIEAMDHYGMAYDHHSVASRPYIPLGLLLKHPEWLRMMSWMLLQHLQTYTKWPDSVNWVRVSACIHISHEVFIRHKDKIVWRCVASRDDIPIEWADQHLGLIGQHNANEYLRMHQHQIPRLLKYMQWSEVPLNIQNIRLFSDHFDLKRCIESPDVSVRKRARELVHLNAGRQVSGRIVPSQVEYDAELIHDFPNLWDVEAACLWSNTTAQILADILEFVDWNWLFREQVNNPQIAALMGGAFFRNARNERVFPVSLLRLRTLPWNAVELPKMLARHSINSKEFIRTVLNLRQDA